MNDEHLIELVWQNPALYDFSNSKYMDSYFKGKIWNGIGNEMDTDGQTCRTRWNNIRDNYRKSLKKYANTKLGQASKKVKLYKYSDQLSFLKPFLEEREAKGNTETQEDEQGSEEVDELEDSIQDIVKTEIDTTKSADDTQPVTGDNSSQSGSDVSVKQTPRKSGIKRAFPQESSSSAFISKHAKLDAPSTSAHAVDPFLAGISPTLKTLSPYLLNLAKSEIFATVQKYELQMLQKGSFGYPQ